MVFRDQQSSELRALSCAHIMCGTDPSGSFAVGDVIQQPAPASLGPPESERLGVLQNFVSPNTPPLFPTNPNVPSGICDAAVCTVERGSPAARSRTSAPSSVCAALALASR